MTSARRASPRFRNWWKELWSQQEGLCFYCDIPMLKSIPADKRAAGRQPRRLATVEHREPKCRGGSPLPHNKVLACSTCNQKKGGMSEVTFRSVYADWLHRKREKDRGQQYEMFVEGSPSPLLRAAEGAAARYPDLFTDN